jgi:hypothetical protein
MVCEKIERFSPVAHTVHLHLTVEPQKRLKKVGYEPPPSGGGLACVPSMFDSLGVKVPFTA